MALSSSAKEGFAPVAVASSITTALGATWAESISRPARPSNSAGPEPSIFWFPFRLSGLCVTSRAYGSNRTLLGLRWLKSASRSETNPAREPGVQSGSKDQLVPQARKPYRVPCRAPEKRPRHTPSGPWASGKDASASAPWARGKNSTVRRVAWGAATAKVVSPEARSTWAPSGQAPTAH
jgi:hypothetical protein